MGAFMGIVMVWFYVLASLIADGFNASFLAGMLVWWSIFQILGLLLYVFASALTVDIGATIRAAVRSLRHPAH